VPAKPAHIRPGLKPVKIPTVDDKVLVSRHEFGLDVNVDAGFRVGVDVDDE
jgi:hypothetical protein